jgi:hypothetical protein
MSVRNRGEGWLGHWVTNFRLRARLIPPNHGLNYTREWTTHRFPVHSDLLQDYNYPSEPMAVNTEAANPEYEWVVQVKQVWDRRVPWNDIVREFKLPFDTSHCKRGKLHHTPGVPPQAVPEAMGPGTVPEIAPPGT